MNKEFQSYLIGEGSVWLFLSCVVFALVGVFVLFALEVRMRDKTSPKTPEEFSWKFLWADNLIRIVGNILIIYIALRFLRTYAFGMITLSDGTVEDKSPTGQLLGSFILGIISDFLWIILKKFRILSNKKIRERFKNAGLADNEND